jgi:class 3 adenylate cyclase/Flp pilus assembly protein TadD
MANVLFLDIVAYSQLHMDQQQQTIQELQDAVRTTSEFARAQAADQLIRLPTGDGMALVFFRDPEAPVRCALELTKILRAKPHIRLRMGIHAGPVYRIADINANRNVAGGGINIAQRVMDCGDSGHILLSKTMADVLRELSSWTKHLHDLGEAEVKHGVRVHLYNLCTEEAGNPERPQKLRAVAVAAAAQGRSSTAKRKISLGLVAACVVAAIVGGGFFFRTPKVQALTEKDTIVLADFDNSTKDPVFDGTLKEALAVEIEQSPFLNTLSDQKVRDTLRLMEKSPEERLTPGLAMEVCKRAHSKALLKGSISALGSQYVLALSAIDCANGDPLARAQNPAASKDTVLQVLGKTADIVRVKLGESLGSKYDMPLEQATTSSLDALSAYTLARKTQSEKGDAASITFYKRAIELDGRFALAYSGLATAYNNLGQVYNAGENARKAFDLREHVSEREKLRIEAFYHSYVTGDTSQAIQAYELWATSYPRDYLPRATLGSLYALLGQFDKSVDETQRAQLLEPAAVVIYSNLGRADLALGKLDQAQSILNEASDKNVDGTILRLTKYQLAFLRGDAAGMAAQMAWAAHKPGEGLFLSSQSDTEAFYGRLRKARETSRRAAEASAASEMSEAAAIWEASAALRESDFGHRDLARRGAEAALSHATGKQLWALAALTLARAGEAPRAQALAEKLQQTYPSDTLLRSYWLPVIRASIELNRGASSKALELLRDAAPYDLADPFPVTSSPLGNMYSVYLRGEAYLQAHQGKEAAAEFQNILDHPGLVLNGPIAALAQAQLARASAMSGDPAKARAQYQSFFTLWKDADSDIPFSPPQKPNTPK